MNTVHPAHTPATNRCNASNSLYVVTIVVATRWRFAVGVHSNMFEPYPSRVGEGKRGVATYETSSTTENNLKDGP
ncbi:MULTISPECIES: hypothetical protein [Halorussus]|uniref:hypothetical protein n=1 Tax=Halorussus TaxID=1070314 RepID=UPI0020A19908|nr:hypothetical protein [Halorussus vallis]USZ74612.1 hypothetical protein NGM07_14340 [Halorussus vallis]